MYPWQQEPIVEKFGSVSVLRDDLIEGGSKVRFLPNLLKNSKEIVYASHKKFPLSNSCILSK